MTDGKGKEKVYHEKPRTMGFGDLQRNADEDRTLYAGGEKSGMAIEGADKPEQAYIKKILEKAQEHPREDYSDEEDEDKPQLNKPFQGKAQTLSGAPLSSPPASSSSSRVARPKKVKRTLTFWRNGFTVNDEAGPLYKYEDVESQKLLQLLQSGRAPLELLDVEYDQAVDLGVSHRMAEDFVIGAKKDGGSSSSSARPFQGSARRLGDMAEMPEKSTAQHKKVEAQSEKAAGKPARLSKDPIIDTSKPITKLQVRFADGTRVHATFNTDMTVAELYNHIRGNNLSSGGREFDLLFGRPPMKLNATDKQTLAQVNLLNDVVFQQWK